MKHGRTSCTSAPSGVVWKPSSPAVIELHPAVIDVHPARGPRFAASLWTPEARVGLTAPGVLLDGLEALVAWVGAWVNPCLTRLNWSF